MQNFFLLLTILFASVPPPLSPLAAGGELECRIADDGSVDRIRVVDLRGKWLFSLGDNPDWSRSQFDDSAWTHVFVPARWEDEGFPGYDGFAWYRIHFSLDDRAFEHPLFLDVGRIDDVDEVFVNGRLVGATGRMPPFPETAYYAFRSYRVPAEYLNRGKDNVVAIRVYDEQLAGGILEGPVGLYEDTSGPVTSVDLTGLWDFTTGAHPDWRGEKNLARAQVSVPARWESQGFADYDGLATYHTSFRVDPDDLNSELYLLLGKVDDLDATFINGVLVGSTGDMERYRVRGDEWQIPRHYKIPPGLLRSDRPNDLTVVVFDGLRDGGIFEGPVGIVTASEFDRAFGKRSWVDVMLDFFFDKD